MGYQSKEHETFSPGLIASVVYSGRADAEADLVEIDPLVWTDRALQEQNRDG